MSTQYSAQKKTEQHQGEYRRSQRGPVMASQQAGDGHYQASHNKHKFRKPQQRKLGGRRKQESQILRPSLAELGEAAIHAGAYSVGSIAKEDLASRSFDRAS
jgi:hypothetical protein